MQRDLKFVRDILRYIIGETPPIKIPFTVPNYEDPMHERETNFLIDLCLDAGFFKTTERDGETYISNLTWLGYDNLERLEAKYPYV